MPIPQSSSAAQARTAVAERLKELRKDAGLHGHELAARCGWHKSKVSRLENGVTAPSDQDIRAWCGACGADDQAADLVARSRTAEAAYVEWKRIQRGGLLPMQEASRKLNHQTRLRRAYASFLIPGLFQTPAYASALLRTVGKFHEIPDDLEAAVESRMKRARVLYEGDHRFTMLLEESVLRYQIGDAECMAGQLGHLLSVMSLPAVSLGIIPSERPRTGMWTLESFNLYDDRQVLVELLSAKITVTAPSEIALYLKAFTELHKMAVHGAEARALITNALKALG
ncbi:helix-turn-helix domain-containing protein [Streptomyces sp. NPDC058861]|uniref:helix-turn-helix domain-containing protein n=1 Tax=Streptomyces sp. NPDC058861 TaxID=3346653 RepID=UPI0036A7353A